MATTAGSPELPSPNTGGGSTHGIDVVSGGGASIDPYEGGSGGGGGTTTLVPTIIQRSRPYFTQAQIDMIKPVEDQAWVSRDTTMRLNACAWILQVGGVLQFPIRTMGTAIQLFNRFKLFYPKWEHSFVDCAAAALFVASKIEDTLKKSREILAVGHSIKHGSGSAEAINPDSPLLDDACRRCLSLERLILESISFDFRMRHPQPFIIKFCRYFNIPRPISRQAWEIQIDIYRTLSPLKATPHTQAYAAIELACKLEGHEMEKEVPYEKWYMNRIGVLDVVKDLLDLWTHYRGVTMVGERFSGDKYIALRIQVNKESEALVGKMKGVNGFVNGGERKEKDGAVAVQALAPGISGLSEKDKLAIGESVRFMLDGERERRERGEGRLGCRGRGDGDLILYSP
ncbi:cyclin-like protein [Terfezia claveryi]|nr:cyclin-like protein [Terfezia claveryi]